MSEWISVKDRLPDDEQEVLVIAHGWDGRLVYVGSHKEDGKMFVRAGCWFSDMAAFRERVKKVHAGTIHKKTYLAACDFAELMLEGGYAKSGEASNFKQD